MMKYSTSLVSSALLLLLLLQPESSGAFSPSGHASSVMKGSPLYYRVPFIGRFREKREVEGKSEPISVGSLIPDMDVEQLTFAESSSSDDEDDENEDESPSIAVPVSIKEVVGTGNSLLVGMPGAFTTSCHSKHLPGYIQAAPKLKDLGIDNIAVVTTNDRFVNDQWSKDLGVVSQDGSAGVTMLCDADGDLVKELGLAEDMGFGIGMRSKRFALLLEDGTVKQVFTDEGMEDCSATSADAMVTALGGAEVQDEEANPAILAGIAGGLLLTFFLLYGGGMEMLNVSH